MVGVGEEAEVSLLNVFTMLPPKIAVIKAANGRNIANGQPIKLDVAIIESTPVCGVAIKNAVAAPLDAPSFLSDIAVGITPHEHNGNGIPKSVAYNTDLKLGFDRNLE